MREICTRDRPRGLWVSRWGGGEGGGESMGIPAGGVSFATSRFAKIFDNGTIYIGTIKS